MIYSERNVPRGVSKRLPIDAVAARSLTKLPEQFRTHIQLAVIEHCLTSVWTNRVVLCLRMAADPPCIPSQQQRHFRLNRRHSAHKNPLSEMPNKARAGLLTGIKVSQETTRR